MNKILSSCTIYIKIWCAFAFAEGVADWSYEKQDLWGQTYEVCVTGLNQSPIILSNVTHVDINKYTHIFGPPYKFVNYDKLHNFDVYDPSDIFSLVLTKDEIATAPRDIVPYVEGGGLNSIYFLHEIEFHWSSSSENGSEHQLEGSKFPAEIQMIHFKEDYENFANALLHKDGLLIVSSWVASSETLKNTWMNDFASYLQKHLKKNIIGEDIDFSELPLVKPGAFLPTDVNSYYRYNGSLSRPPCLENVQWVVFEQSIHAPRVFLMALRAAFPNKIVTSRRIQARKNIFIAYRSVDQYDYSSDLDEISPILSDIYNEELETPTSDWTRLPDDKAKEYCYHDEDCKLTPTNWNVYFPECKIGLQSPIDLKMKDVNRNEDTNYVPLDYYLQTYSTFSLPIFSDDYGISVHFPKIGPRWEIYDPINNETFVLSRIKIHWGSSANWGSEHSIDGKKYPFELQFIHFKSEYKSLKKSLGKKDGLLIISKLYELKKEGKEEPSNYVTMDESPMFELIISSIRKAWESLRGVLSTHFTEFSGELFVGWSLSPTILIGTPSSYFVYEGSLTMPPCTTGVIWVVKDTPGLLHKSQWDLLNELRGLRGTSMANNARPVQPTQGRKIFYKKYVNISPRLLVNYDPITPTSVKESGATSLFSADCHGIWIFGTFIIIYFTLFLFSF